MYKWDKLIYKRLAKFDLFGDSRFNDFYQECALACIKAERKADHVAYVRQAIDWAIINTYRWFDRAGRTGQPESELIDTYANQTDRNYNRAIDQLALKDLYEVLNEREKMVLDNKIKHLKGDNSCTNRALAKELNVSEQNIIYYYQMIRDKAKKLMRKCHD